MRLRNESALAARQTASNSKSEGGFGALRDRLGSYFPNGAK